MIYTLPLTRHVYGGTAYCATTLVIPFSDAIVAYKGGIPVFMIVQRDSYLPRLNITGSR